MNTTIEPQKTKCSIIKKIKNIRACEKNKKEIAERLSLFNIFY